MQCFSIEDNKIANIIRKNHEDENAENRPQPPFTIFQNIIINLNFARDAPPCNRNTNTVHTKDPHLMPRDSTISVGVIKIYETRYKQNNICQNVFKAIAYSHCCQNR